MHESVSTHANAQVRSLAVHGAPSVGVDLVHIPSFREQWEAPGTTISGMFTPYELRQARKKMAVTGDVFQHLAARWAAKEAFIKAWSGLIAPAPPLIASERVVWRDIEVRSDHCDRPYLHLHGEVQRLSSPNFASSLSLSHDGDYAVAVVALAQSHV
ncbi:holo-ACP synthase [Corynebacterium glucuronolyticum]|uniref:Holo-[acyl-carrier-protein] synthase n=2 Tax=Corynebacterium glucuronolyticum TaxID=39791 RepID=A0A7T4EEJ7_9CORY|nr:holo-ACP synthase [Corynebacterium glucuronolyticum]QQU87553.1 holo-ACP synthase [Corynebacterium glucuronolyticum]QRP71550.1 holo-ACP synthase [Corynebacterium glucuronolyticum]WKD63341.1 Holo-[acyl-carrier-protein] synthase [Corynebacterium glucuronolyticum DSM 44120]SMB80118.1 holo-[acyl-carrier protein] synthase [Corynebacterium glucuronolyticum]